MEKDKNPSNTERIESDKNPFPTMDIIPGVGWVKKVGNLICFIYFARDDEIPNTGGAVTLDDTLYDLEEHRMQTYWGSLLDEEHGKSA